MAEGNPEISSAKLTEIVGNLYFSTDYASLPLKISNEKEGVEWLKKDQAEDRLLEFYVLGCRDWFVRVTNRYGNHTNP